MLLENINEVIKASPAIQIQGKMTHLQRAGMEHIARQRL